MRRECVESHLTIVRKEREKLGVLYIGNIDSIVDIIIISQMLYNTKAKSDKFC